MTGRDLQHGDAFVRGDGRSTRKFVYWDLGKPEDCGSLDFDVVRGMGGINIVWRNMPVRLIPRWDGYMRSGQPAPLPINKRDWPHLCPTCGGPAVLMFTTIDCKDQCERRADVTT